VVALNNRIHEKEGLMFKRRFLALLITGVCISSAHSAETLTYSYDVLGRLRAVQISGGPANGALRSYQLDAMGNRTQLQFTVASGRSAVTFDTTDSGVDVTSMGVVVSVTLSGSESPGGVVTFSENGTFLGKAFVYDGQASVVLEGLSAGVHTITASYSGDDSNAPYSHTFTIKVQDRQ
jgi:hypothetical protein